MKSQRHVETEGRCAKRPRHKRNKVKTCVTYTELNGCWQQINPCPHHHAPLFNFTRPITIHCIVYTTSINLCWYDCNITTQDGVVFTVDFPTKSVSHQVSLHDIYNRCGQDWWLSSYICNTRQCTTWGEHCDGIIPYMLQLKVGMDKYLLIGELLTADVCANIKQQFIMLLSFYPTLFVRPSN